MDLKYKILSPVLNIVAVILIILSREEFDWFAIAASVIILLSVGSIIYVYKTAK